MQIAVLSLILLVLITFTSAGPIYTHSDAVRRVNQPQKRYVVVHSIDASQEGRRRRQAPTDPGDQVRAAQTSSPAEASKAPTGGGSKDGKAPAVGVGAGNISDLSFLTETAPATTSAPGAAESSDIITTIVAAAAVSATDASPRSETTSASKGSEDGKVPAVGVGAGNTSNLSFLTQTTTSSTAGASLVSETTVTTTVPAASNADSPAAATQQATDIAPSTTIGGAIVSETSTSPATVTNNPDTTQPAFGSAFGTVVATESASDHSNPSSVIGTGTAIVPPARAETITTQPAPDFASTTTVQVQTTIFTTVDVTAEVTAAAVTSSLDATTEASTQQNQQSTDSLGATPSGTELPSSSPSSPLASVAVVFVTASPATTASLTPEATIITPGLGTISIAQTALSEPGTPLPVETNVPSEEPRPSTLSTASPFPDPASSITTSVQPSGIEGKGQQDAPTTTTPDPVVVVPVTSGPISSPVVTQAQAQGPAPVTEIITETVTTTVTVQ